MHSNIIKLKVSDYPIQNGRIDKWIIEAFSLLIFSVMVFFFFSNSPNLFINPMIKKNKQITIKIDKIIVINFKIL